MKAWSISSRVAIRCALALGGCLFASTACSQDSNGEARETKAREPGAAAQSGVGAQANSDVEAAIRALLLCEDFDCEDAQRAVVQHRDAALDLLTRILDHGASERLAAGTELPEETLRRRAAGALGDLGSPRAMDPLRRASLDPSPLIRAEAVRAIGRLDATGGTDALVALIDDPDPLVRESVADALAGSRRVDILDELRAAAVREEHPQVREAFERTIRTLERL